MCRSEMCLPENHRLGFVPHEDLTKVVEVKLGKSGILDRSHVLLPEIPSVHVFAEGVWKNKSICLANPFCYSFMRLRRSAFKITDTELKLIAAAAMMGESSKPKKGYSTPAATGIPSKL